MPPPERHEQPCRWLRGEACECKERRRARAEAESGICRRCCKKLMGGPGDDLCWCPDD